MATARKAPAKPAAKKGVVAGKVPPLEWAAAAVGLVLALGVIGVILTEAMSGERTPPELSVRLVSVTPFTDGYNVEVEVRNTGGSTASAVAIEGELKAGGEPEIAEAAIDYVPARSKSKAGLVFRSDPRSGDLTLYAKGYADP